MVRFDVLSEMSKVAMAGVRPVGGAGIRIELSVDVDRVAAHPCTS